MCSVCNFVLKAGQTVFISYNPVEDCASEFCYQAAHFACAFASANVAVTEASRASGKFELDFDQKLLEHAQIEADYICDGAHYLYFFFQVAQNFQMDFKKVINNLLLSVELTQDTKCNQPCKNCHTLYERLEKYNYVICEKTLSAILTTLAPRKMQIVHFFPFPHLRHDNFWFLKADYGSYTNEDLVTFVDPLLCFVISECLPVHLFDELFPLFKSFMKWLYDHSKSFYFQSNIPRFHYAVSDALYLYRTARIKRKKYGENEKLTDTFILNDLLHSILEDKYNSIYKNFIDAVTPMLQQ